MSFIEEHLDKHPIYKRISFRTAAFPTETNLHALLRASQAVIDYLIETGKRRIAIVLPDDDTVITNTVS